MTWSQGTHAKENPYRKTLSRCTTWKVFVPPHRVVQLSTEHNFPRVIIFCSIAATHNLQRSTKPIHCQPSCTLAWWRRSTTLAASVANGYPGNILRLATYLG